MVVAVEWGAGRTLPPPPDAPVGSDAFVRVAEEAGRHLPPAVLGALHLLRGAPPVSGALLIRDVPVGEPPATPARPTDPFAKDRTSELALLAVARRLGQPVGYLPEHGGDLVQNLVPTEAGADRQVSTSSRVDLAFHTETAFHPHAPSHLVLLCLRGHPEARTTLCSVHDLVDALDAGTVDVLRQPRFTCGVDESFLGHDPGGPAPRATAATGPRAVIGGSDERPTLWYDAELMRGTDAAARAALDQLGRAVLERQRSVVLEAGDCLVVDNAVAVHGRSSYAARFDGTDRWLQRAFVVADLAPSVTERRGRIILTRFG